MSRIPEWVPAEAAKPLEEGIVQVACVWLAGLDLETRHKVDAGDVIGQLATEVWGKIEANLETQHNAAILRQKEDYVAP